MLLKNSFWNRCLKSKFNWITIKSECQLIEITTSCLYRCMKPIIKQIPHKRKNIQKSSLPAPIRPDQHMKIAQRDAHIPQRPKILNFDSRKHTFKLVKKSHKRLQLLQFLPEAAAQDREPAPSLGIQIFIVQME